MKMSFIEIMVIRIGKYTTYFNMIMSAIQIRCYPVKKRGVKAMCGKLSLEGKVTNLVKSFAKICVSRVHL